MAIDNPVKVPQKKITSVDVPNAKFGLFLGGDQNAPVNSIVASKDTELDPSGYLIPRRKLAPFLPDTVEITYQKYPVSWQGHLYYFTADSNKIRFCQEGDSDWTDCASPGVAAHLTTALTGANNDLTFTSTVLGATGNSTAIIYLNPGTPSAALSVSVVGTVITVHLATDGSSAITSTASQILAAVQASGSASALVTVALAAANTGAGVVTALSSTPLAGGSGTNIITTNKGGFPKFLRVLDSVLLLNGTNGDKLAYVDLTTAGFPVVKFSAVTDPITNMTSAGLTGGALNIYYAYSYEGTVGETLLSPILTISVNTARDQWQTQTTPIKNTLTFHDTPPAGAQFRNLYVAIAATGGVISTDDMLQIATGLDLSNTTFVDDGSLSINLGSIAPIVNSTDGPRVDHGIAEEGNPILYGDIDTPYNIWIGGGGLNALKFTISNGGYKAQPELGTNFYPTSVIGFRNGQGIPSLTVLFSNTEGLSKQAVLAQQTVTYGNQSFTVWGVTEQHYGSAGVSAPNSPVNYNGKLLFFSSDGIMSMDTQINRLNVMSVVNISTLPLHDYIDQIKTSAMKNIVGTGWNDKFMWLVPNTGFDTPQQILIYDNSNNKTAFGTMDIQGQWIGVVTPQSDPAFVYISQGKSTYKLLQSESTYDIKGGVNVPFSTGATGAMIGMGEGEAHNEWQANVQVMFYIMKLIGSMTIGVTYRNQNGRLKIKTKQITGPVFVPSIAGGWGDPGWSYGAFAAPSWSKEPVIDDSAGIATAVDVRKAIQIDDIFNEAQWFYSTPVGFNNYKIKAISYEGISLGVRPDLA